MDISIIILNYKQLGLVKHCIRGIYRSGPKCIYEIIVVDNHSQDGCDEIINELYPEVNIIVSKKNYGYAAGNNLGINHSKGKYIMIINPDIVITQGIIDTMIRYMDQHPNIGILGPKLKYPDGSLQYSKRRFPTWIIPIYRRTFLGNFNFAQSALRRYLMQDIPTDRNIAVDWIFGACLFIRKKAIEEIGLFDERFFMYFEDLDLCRRFWGKKWEVWYLADVEIVHYHHRESAESSGFRALFNTLGRQHIYSGFKYFFKYVGVKNPR